MSLNQGREIDWVGGGGEQKKYEADRWEFKIEEGRSVRRYVHSIIYFLRPKSFAISSLVMQITEYENNIT